MNTLGGRKAAITILGILCVTGLAYVGKDSVAYGSIALMVSAFVAGNAYGKRKETPNA